MRRPTWGSAHSHFLIQHRKQPGARLVRNPKYGYETASARAECSCELPLMLLPLFRSSLPRPQSLPGILKDKEGCAALGSLLRTEFHPRTLSRPRVCRSFALVTVSAAICGKINTELCSTLYISRQPFSIHRGENTQVQWTTAVCKLFFYHSDSFEAWVISRNAAASAQACVSYRNLHLQDPGEVRSHGHAGLKSQVPSISHTGMKKLVRWKSGFSHCY